MSGAPAAAERASRARAWGRLFRLSLFPTAAADVLAGLVLAGGGSLPGFRATALLVAASLGVYHANVALNDWADREADRRTRPDRPLPSGAVPSWAALAAIGVAAAIGIACGFAARPAAGAWIAGVCALAAFYDLRGRGPWSGPVLLGLCRAGNLALGFAFVGIERVPEILWSAPLLYGAYVFVVSRLGRLEDAEDRDPSGRRPRRHLATAAALCVCAALLPIPGATLAARLAALVLAAAGAAGLVRRVREVRAWTPAAVGASMGLALRRLLVLSASFALLAGSATGALVALAILCGFPISFRLRELFPPS